MIPVEPIHYDESVYPSAKTFKPFRFAEPNAIRNILDLLDTAPSAEGKPRTKMGDHRQQQQTKQKSGATIDEVFLGFGFGLHACPGRFFALNELKIFIATMVLNYDIEPLKTRPKMTPLIWLNVPLFKNFQVNVRRRRAVELE
ncbi:hypothetical protein ONZ43_g860 [Nemania bipapillata]|uniref:Uncharacterized protein n=1 Tax=Nemania bipapillata TaxID=110536 RepID=A0ACC2J6J6_9PEZI|nr:hypothetical protein ONZ43_g860 [Nemania bipapillata]